MLTRFWLGLTLALTAIWLNIFSCNFINFISSNIQKRSSSFVVQDLTFIFIQANVYVKTCTSMQISRCHQDKTMVSDNFKRIFIILRLRKLNMFNFFILKWKRIKLSFFVKHTVILIWSFKNDHFKIIVYFSFFFVPIGDSFPRKDYFSASVI